MTDRLAQLMHHEADTLTVPPPQTGAVLASGHRLVRRRRIGLAAASVGVAGVLVAGAAIGAGLGDPPRPDHARIDPATAAYLAQGAWARGSTIHVGDATTTIDGQVKALYYTSAGVVVRSGDVAYTDDSGPSQYGVVGPDGAVHSLGLDLGDRAPATDPTEPYLAYADGSGSTWHIKVVDVRTGEQVGDAVVAGAFTWGGWEAPPVALSGDTVYVGTDDQIQAVDWRTGEVQAPRPWLAHSEMPEVAGGHYVTGDMLGGDQHPRSDLSVLDVDDGSKVLERQVDGYAFLSLSPDGRYAKLTVEEDPTGDTPSGFDVFDLATGEPMHFPMQAWDFGWTPDGNLLRVDDDTASVCSPTTGTCEEHPAGGGKGALKIAGNSYES